MKTQCKKGHNLNATRSVLPNGIQYCRLCPLPKGMKRRSYSQVYLVQCGGPVGPVKVGFTKNCVHQRMKDGSVFNPFDLTLLATCLVLEGIPAARYEKQIQRLFKRVSPNSGEWFRPDTELLLFVRTQPNECQCSVCGYDN